MGYIKLKVDDNTQNIPEEFHDELYIITAIGCNIL